MKEGRKPEYPEKTPEDRLPDLTFSASAFGAVMGHKTLLLTSLSLSLPTVHLHVSFVLSVSLLHFMFKVKAFAMQNCCPDNGLPPNWPAVRTRLITQSHMLLTGFIQCGRPAVRTRLMT